ncbi:MAG: ion transporter [Myxococcota bacterium]
MSTGARRLRRIMEHPATEVGVLLLIVASVALLVAEVAVRDQPRTVLILESIGNGLTAIFAIEMMIRFSIAKKKSRFFRHYWLDLLALVPLARPLRILRVLRLLRLWRAGRLISRRLLPYQSVFRVAFTELTTLATISLAVVLSAALMLNLAEPATFQTLQSSLWFSVMSLIAGEPVGALPTTTVGRWATLVLMLGGLTVFGMFVGTVSASVGERLRGRMEGHEMDVDELEEHIVVCGWNGSAPMLLRELFAPGIPSDRAVVVITETDGRPDDWPTDGVRPERLFHISGDWTRLDVLDAVNIREANTAILLRDVLKPRSDQDRDARTVLAALTIELVNKDIYTVAELHSSQSEEMLRMRGVEEVVVGEVYAGMILGSAARNPGLAHLLSEILDLRSGNSFWSTRCPPQHDGATVAELRRVLHERFGATLMSIEPDGAKVVVNPNDSVTVAAGTTLMVVARGPVKW